MSKKQYHQCPNLNCQSNWGIEEISFQECDACGWPNVDEEEEFKPEFDDYDLDWPDEDDL
jgi:hypothetical protein